MKKVLSLLVLAFSINSFAQTAPNRPQAIPAAAADLTQYGVRIEPDKRLIVMMAALEAAGIETSLGESGTQFRQKLKTDLSGVNPDLRQRMAAFLKAHKDRNSKMTPAELTAPFISLAYAMGQVPELTATARSLDLPDDLLEVLDFAPLVQEFYRTTGFEAKLAGYVQLYQAEGDKMRISAGEMVKSLLDYLRTKPELYTYERVKTEVPDPKNKNKKIEAVKPVERERRFFIVPDLLASAGTVNFRNIGDEYYAIVPPNTNLRFSEARRAYLQYVLEPVVIKNAKDILTHRAGIKALLDEQRKTNENISPDVFLAVSRSLVAAIDARETEALRVQDATFKARQNIDKAQGVEAKKTVSARLETDKKAFADETALDLSNAYERGAVLAFYFAEQLKGVESSGFDISSSLREMILTLDPAKEQNRLAQYADARRRGVTAREERRKQATAQMIVNSEASARRQLLKTKLDEIEVATKAEIARQKDARNFEEVETRLKQVLSEFPNEASVYYALGRVASLSASEAFDEALRDKRLDDARLNYNNAIRQANNFTDPVLIQLSYVALGKICEFYEENSAALQNYQLALNLNVKGSAHDEAVAAVKRLTEAPQKPQ